MWISVKDQLPNASGAYLCACRNGHMMVLPFSWLWGLFNAYDNNDYVSACKYAIDVDFWMSIPELPITEDRQ